MKLLHTSGMRMENLKTSEIKKYIIIERQEVMQPPNSWGPGATHRQGTGCSTGKYSASGFKTDTVHSQSTFETLNYCSQERKKCSF